MQTRQGMITPGEALGLVSEAAAPLSPRAVPLSEACGLRLAEPIRADRDHPPFLRATRDGYAVRIADAGRTVVIGGEAVPGEHTDIEVTAGSCVEIMTGAPCPPGTEAVVQKEDTIRNSGHAILPSVIRFGQNIMPRGSECPAGQTALRIGETITPMAVAVLASFGVRSVRVTPRPSLAVVSTGPELVPPDHDPTAGKIRDSNTPMLLAMARNMGLERPLGLHAGDRLKEILTALDEVTGRDIVLLTGGVSVGKYDLVPQAVQQYGARLVFHGVSQRPGKPLLVARKGPQLVFGLPGNPLSCHLCFHRYVAAAIRRKEGKPPAALPFQGHLAEPIEGDPDRTCFVPACAQRAQEAQTDWCLHPLPGVSSADVFTSCGANCYVEVPPRGRPAAGEVVPFTWLAGMLS